MSPARPRRTCVGCRVTDDADALVRFALTGGEVRVDAERRLPGRGVWLHASADCLALALRKRAIQRGLRANDADVSSLADGAWFA